MESFLSFWNGHNDTIIEVLVALILFLVIYLAFKYFFGPEIAEAGVSVNTGEIEKTLQRILEAQNIGAQTVSASAPVAAPAPVPASAVTSAADQAEMERLRKEIGEKEKLLAIARDAATQAQVPGASAAAGANNAKELETKLKDLEARLAEYEIISEDIADLSFYKEENARLQSELTSVKGGAGAAVPPVTVAATPTEAPTSIPATPVAAPKPETPAAEAAPTAADEQIIKDFAQAVKDQKDPTAPPPAGKNDAKENSELMSQFENFVKKG